MFMKISPRRSTAHCRKLTTFKIVQQPAWRGLCDLNTAESLHGGLCRAFDAASRNAILS